MKKQILINTETGKIGSGINPLNFKVYTITGKLLGKVSEIQIDKNFDVLKKLIVTKKILVWKKSRTINWEDIIEIQNRKIIVKDDLGFIKEKTALSFSDSTV